ncbi:hypothetical protein AAFN86_01495 [Roseomonas sp. CAU 1739]|uniref:hypothetical protein n=1 Tax=Roseomonas sp. CAU 1739 TaxID=3140364 RepID=UPI00325A5C9A
MDVRRRARRAPAAVASEPAGGTGGEVMKPPPGGHGPALTMGVTPNEAATEAPQARRCATARRGEPIAIEAAGRAQAGAVQPAMFARAMRRTAARMAAIWQRVGGRGEGSPRAAGGEA